MPLSFQPEDVSRTRRLLLECSRYLRGGELYPDCQFDPARPCRHVPPACTRYNAAYTILHFLADDNFALPGVSSERLRVVELVVECIMRRTNSYVARKPWNSHDMVRLKQS